MRIALIVSASLALSAAMFGQAPAASPEFEVASIKPSAPMTNFQVNVGVHIDGAQVRCTYLSLKDYIRMAYDVKDFEIQGPEWLASARFDIAAKLPDGAPGDQIRPMIKSLLDQRFHIKTHRETKELPVYALVVGKGGPKLKESAPPPPDGGKPVVNVAAQGGPQGVTLDLGKGSYFTFGDNKIEAGKLTMTAFADTLSRFVDRPVVDMTDLTGNYDFTLEFTPEDYAAMRVRSAVSAGVTLPPEAMRVLEIASGDSLFTAVQTLGLKLDARKAPLAVLVVDQIAKAPTEN